MCVCVCVCVFIFVVEDLNLVLRALKIAFDPDTVPTARNMQKVPQTSVITILFKRRNPDFDCLI